MLNAAPGKMTRAELLTIVETTLADGTMLNLKPTSDLTFNEKLASAKSAVNGLATYAASQIVAFNKANPNETPVPNPWEGE